MRTYIIKRILIMIPTFFVISLIIFVILNFAPGTPGESKAFFGGSVVESAQESIAKQEAFKIFKEQFNLDKPVIFNTRFALKKETVLRHLENILNENRSVDPKTIIKSKTIMSDLGEYSVPALIAIMNEAQNSGIRDLAVRYLSQNAKRRLINPYAKKLPEKIKQKNREIDRENVYIRSLFYRASEPENKKQEIIMKWNQWYREHKDRFQYSFWQKVRIFFFDTRFAKYWSSLLRLDFGISHVTKEPVIEKIVGKFVYKPLKVGSLTIPWFGFEWGKMKYSLILSVTSLIIAYVIAIPLGIFSAVKQNTLADRIISVILFMLYSLPSFFVATLLLFTFSEGSNYYHWFPTGGFQRKDYLDLTTLGQIKDIVWHIILPLFCMTYGSYAALSRYARSGLLEVIRADYIRTARAKGLSEFVVIFKHAVRNGIIPIVTLMATLLPVVVSGSAIIEYIFGIPGMGLLVIDAIAQRDYNVIMGVQLISVFLVLIGVLLADITYALVDPRITFK